MPVIPLTAFELPKMLAAHEKKLPQAIKAGIKLGAQRGRTHLVRHSPVDLGQFKNAWRVRDGIDGPEIVNDAPHAGIIELGARPHNVNRAGIDALTAWALRKLMSGTFTSKTGGAPGKRRGKTKALQAEARSIAFAIAAKLKKHGQKGRYIVLQSLPMLGKILASEVARQINKALATKGLI